MFIKIEPLFDFCLKEAASRDGLGANAALKKDAVSFESVEAALTIIVD